MLVESLSYRRNEQASALRAWIEPGTTAILIRQDLQRKMRTIGDRIKSKRPSIIQFDKDQIEKLAIEIQEKRSENNIHSSGKIKRPDEAARKAAISIANIVQGEFKSKEKIDLMGQPEQFEQMASMVYSNPARSAHEGKGTYKTLCEAKKNECRKLIIMALEIVANPKKSVDTKI